MRRRWRLENTEQNMMQDLLQLPPFPPFQYVNRAFLELSGYSMEEVIGEPALDIMKPFDTKLVRENTREYSNEE